MLRLAFRIILKNQTAERLPFGHEKQTQGEHFGGKNQFQSAQVQKIAKFFARDLDLWHPSNACEAHIITIGGTLP